MGWMIAGGILLALALILSLSVVLRVRVTEEFALSVGILCFHWQIFPEKPAKKKKPKAAPKKAAKKVSRKKKRQKVPAPEKKPEKGDIQGTAGIVIDLLKAALPPLGQMLRHLRLVRLDARIWVGGSDAAETALAFGKIQALFYGGYDSLQNLIRVKAKRVEIGCDFLLPETRQDISFDIKLRIGVILGALLRMTWRFLAHTIRKGQQPEPAVQAVKK